MKKISSLVIVLSAFIACQKKTSEDFNLTLKGEIKGIKTGTLYIQQLQDSSLVILDSIVFDGKSSFESRLNIESPEMLYLFLNRGGLSNSIDNNLPVFVEPGVMTLHTDRENFYANAKITGSTNHELWETHIKNISGIKNRNLALTNLEFKALRHKNQSQLDSIYEAKDLLTKRKYLITINFALNNKDKEIAPYLALSEVFDARIKYLDTINNALTPEVARSKYGKILTSFIEERKTKGIE
jgi:hypothetical protein